MYDLCFVFQYGYDVLFLVPPLLNFANNLLLSNTSPLVQIANKK